MRKTSTYARKRAHQPIHYNGAEWLNAIGRCRAYTDEPVIGSWLPGTAQISTGVLVEARLAYQRMKDGLVEPQEVQPYDMLAHVYGVAEIRAVEIAGREGNPMIPVIVAANEALLRTRARWEKLGRWGFDGPPLPSAPKRLTCTKPF
jgi:hypothetical protein